LRLLRAPHGAAAGHHGGVRRLVSSVALAATLALVLAFSAFAHLSAAPAFLTAGAKQRIVLTVHNDRDRTMSGFRLTVPSGLRILGTGGGETWNEVVEGASATWSGGALAPAQPTTFEVDLEVAAVGPGTVELQGDQLYADGESVRWPVTLTIVPPGGTADGDEGAVSAAAIAILTVLGVLVVGTFALVVWQRRRARPLQER
jgi:hypothetical protein